MSESQSAVEGFIFIYFKKRENNNISKTTDKRVAAQPAKPGASATGYAAKGAKANAEWVKQQRPLHKMCRSDALVGIS